MPQTLSVRQNFLALPKKHSQFDKSKIAVLPVPYEHTVSYGSGTKNGPKAILDASHYVEFYDEELERELCFDVGIVTLKPLDFGTKKKKVDEAALKIIQKSVAGLIERGKFVATLGGEHILSFAPIVAHHERYDNVSVLQFDAHSDFRNEYQGNKYSHASVMARVAEVIPPERIVQVGIRAQAKEEAEFIKTHNVSTYYSHEIRSGKYTRILKYWEDQVVEKLSDNVYITFDIDCFDPSEMPATGTPEPNGMFWYETMNLLRKVGQKKNIVGFDVVELSPIKGLSFPNITAAKLVYKLMNYAFMLK